ncbi:MAG: hypothetical protein DRR04_07075 [Gammaproteobacteria bacterium]|nr:MAG: hypothetical protein DRR04_07075 [Gammaproteobacteria bacterium]
MKTNNIPGKFLALAIATPCITFPQLSLAQGNVMEEVVVTARKRQESLQETPVAVTALSSEALRDANIRNLADLTTTVPGLDAKVGSKSGEFAIRGVGARDNKNVRTDPAVGVYVDGIFIPRNDSQLMETIDLESVQVLRGPQGTLFGKNTAGGALLLTTTKPGNEFAGEVTGEAGNLGRQNLRGTLNIPLLDDVLLGRFTVDSRTRDGYMEDAETRYEYGDEDKLALAAQLRWLPSEELTIDLLLFHSKQDEMAAPQSCILANPGTILQGFTAPGDSRSLPEACKLSEQLRDRQKVLNDREGVRWEMESTMAGLTIDWELGDLTLRSVTGLLHQQDINNWRDQDASPIFSIQNLELVNDQLEANGFEADQERDFLSQEFQLTGSAFEERLDYTVGLFGSVESLDNNPDGTMISSAGFLGIADGDDVNVLPVTRTGWRGSSISSYDNKTWAVFSQLSWHFDEQWQLTLGGRYSVEDKEVDVRNYISTEQSPGRVSREEFDDLVGTLHTVIRTPGQEREQADDDWNEFTPMVSLSYLAPDAWLDDSGLDSLMVYVTYSGGFKAGGFTNFGNELTTFDPETVDNYELGVKLDAMDNRLRLNVALYSMDYTDMQLTVTRQINDTQVGSLTANAGEATLQGVEVELSIVPTEHWLFQFSGNYLDASYDEFNDLVRDPDSGDYILVDRSDEPFGYTPETSFNVVAQYAWSSGWGDFAARLSGYYRDEVYIGLTADADLSPLSTLDSYDLWNARLSWQLPTAADVHLAVYVDNFTDEEYFGTGNIELSAQGTLTAVPGLQRTYGLQASYRF